MVPIVRFVKTQVPKLLELEIGHAIKQAAEDTERLVTLEDAITYNAGIFREIDELRLLMHRRQIQFDLAVELARTYLVGRSLN